MASEKRIRTTAFVGGLAAGAALAAAVGVGGPMMARAQEKLTTTTSTTTTASAVATTTARQTPDKEGEKKAVLTADQVIASIRTAVAAKPGGVTGVEAETEGGKTVCEVGIRATQDGKDYEVEVDVATNRVIEVEAEDAEDAPEKGTADPD